MPRSTATSIKARCHSATHVRDVGLGSASDEDIANFAQAQNLAILSRDFDFANVRDYPPDQYAGIAVIDLPSVATAPTILKLVDDFLQQTQILKDLPGRLAIIAP